MRRYLYEFHAPPDALAGFSINAHANAVHNPLAMFRKAISAQHYEKAAVVSDPLNMFDAAPIADGAAALLLARADSLPENFPSPLVRILASAATTTAFALHDQPDPLVLSAAAASAAQVFQRSGHKPEAMDLFELHDTFSILSALALEAAGYAARGEGWKLAADGHIHRDGTIPICTFGGSKARGDAGGATGVIQVGEVARQLQGLAGGNQVQGARLGMAQCLGGIGATAVAHILEQVDTI
jgi:acetyl-CoA C-acetyltransferase